MKCLVSNKKLRVMHITHDEKKSMNILYTDVIMTQRIDI